MNKETRKALAYEVIDRYLTKKYATATTQEQIEIRAVQRAINILNK